MESFHRDMMCPTSPLTVYVMEFKVLATISPKSEDGRFLHMCWGSTPFVVGLPYGFFFFAVTMGGHPYYMIIWLHLWA